MIYRAKHRYADVSARKMRPLATMIRGMNVDVAIEALQFMPNRGARLIEAVVKSAVGNAEDLGCPDVAGLIVGECRIDDGPMFKRIRPRARGTAFGIKRRMAHIIVTLADEAALEASAKTPSSDLAPAGEPAPAPAVQSAPAGEPAPAPAAPLTNAPAGEPAPVPASAATN